MIIYLLHYIGQLKIMYYMEKNIHTKIKSYIVQDSGELSMEYQKLGKEAQDKVGVPLEYQVPIKKHVHHNKDEYAHCRSDGIYVNEAYVNNTPTIFQKYVLYHESVHKKFNHNTAIAIMSGVFSLSIAWTLAIMFHFTPFNTMYKILIPYAAAAIVSIPYVNDKLHYYGERQADTEALYAMNCHQCVDDLLHVMKREKDDGGYLTTSEMHLIAQEMKKQNKLCVDHS